MTDESMEAYRRFLVVRDDYTARERVASESTERTLIAGAAGALALSVTFLEKIAPSPSPVSLVVLGSGWIMLLLSLGGTLLSYAVRSRAYRMAREALDASVLKGDMDLAAVDLGGVKRLNRMLDWLGYFRLGTLLVGTVALVVFAFINV